MSKDRLQPAWDQRIARAKELAQRHAYAAEILNFYEEVTRLQKRLYADLKSAYGEGIEKRSERSLRDELDLNVLVRGLPTLFAVVKCAAPATLADAAAKLASDGQSKWVNLLTAYWRAGA